MSGDDQTLEPKPNDESEEALAATTAGEDSPPLELLERLLTTRAAEIAAAEAEWMGWLIEYIELEGWTAWGATGPAHWLSWKCGFSMSAAHERVRVARALPRLPIIRQQFEQGLLSYTKVVALTRVANEHNEQDLALIAAHATGSQLSRICKNYRVTGATSKDTETTAFELRSVTERRKFDGTTAITIIAPDADASAIMRFLNAQAQELIEDATGAPTNDLSRREVIAERGGISAMRADAAIALLTGTAGRVAPLPTEVTMVVTTEDRPAASCSCAQDSTATTAWSAQPARTTEAVDPNDEFPGSCTHEPEPGSDVHDKIAMLLDGMHDLGPNAAKRLLCDPRITSLIEGANKQPLAVGRATRFINRRLRRALERRDNHSCRFPGCHAHQRLHAHHIVHWAHGGPTELDNLILLCHFHHHLVHEGGWNIDPATKQFLRPDNTPVDPTPELLRAGVGPIEPHRWQGPEPGPLEPPVYDPVDMDLTIWMLHHNEALNRQQAASDRSEVEQGP